MATLKAVFELTDRVSPELNKIATAAKAIDTSFMTTEKRLVSFQDELRDTTSKAAREMTVMKETFKVNTGAMKREISELKTELRLLTKSKWKVDIDADTLGAHAKLAVLRRDLARGGRGNFNAGGGGGVGRAFGGFGSGGGNKGPTRTSGTLSFNVGPITASGAKLAALMATALPAGISLVTAAVGVLNTALVSLTAAATAAGFALIGFGAGIAAIAIPIGIAISKLATKRKALKSAHDRMEKAEKGTKQYANALEDYNRILSKIPANQAEVIRNLDKLGAQWNKLVMNGPSGKRAFDLINDALRIAGELLPFAAHQMDRFTLSAKVLFNNFERRTPTLKKQLETLFIPMPRYFRSISLSLSNFVQGLVGVGIAATPMTNFLVKGLADISKRFNDFSNSVNGRKSIREFFTGMIPVTKALFGLIYDLGDAMIKIAMDPKVQKGTLDFIDFLRDFLKELPGFVSQMTDAAGKLGPLWRRLGRSIEKFSEDVAPIVNTILEKVFGPLSKAFVELPDPARHAFEALLIFGGLSKVLVGPTQTLLKFAEALFKVAAGQAAMAASGMIGPGIPIPGMGKFGSRGRIGKMTGGGGALAFPGNKAFPNAGYETGKLSGAARGSAAAGGANIGSHAPSVFGTKFAGGAAGRTMPRGAMVLGGMGGMAEGAAGAGLLGASTAGMGAGAAAAGPGIVAALAPAVAIIAAIGIAVAGMWLAWKNNFGHVKEYTSEVWDSVKSKFADAGESISKIFEELGMKNKGFTDAMQKTWEGIKVVLMAVGAVLIRVVGGAFDILGSVVKAFFKIALGLIQAFKGAFKIAIGAITGDWSTMWDGMKDVAEGAVNIIKGLIGGIKDIFFDVAAALGIDIGRGDKKGGKAVSELQVAPSPFNPFGVGVNTGGGQTAMNPNVGAGGGSTAVGDGPGIIGGLKRAGGAALSMTPLGGIIQGVKAIGGLSLEAGDKLVKGLINKTPGNGLVGQLARGGATKLWDSAKNFLQEKSATFGTGGAVSTKGLLPQVAKAAAGFAKMFPGLHMSSGFRTGAAAITEFGNKSLHGMGRAIDMAGPQNMMQALWQYLQGNKGIQELIYNGQASYSGGPVVPFTGSDKHTDHVHVGFGDGPGDPRKPNNATGPSGLTIHISFDGAEIHINNGQDKEDFFNDLGEAIRFHAANLPNEDASEVG